MLLIVCDKYTFCSYILHYQVWHCFNTTRWDNDLRVKYVMVRLKEQFQRGRTKGAGLKKYHKVQHRQEINRAAWNESCVKV